MILYFYICGLIVLWVYVSYYIGTCGLPYIYPIIHQALGVLYKANHTYPCYNYVLHVIVATEGMSADIAIRQSTSAYVTTDTLHF